MDDNQDSELIGEFVSESLQSLRDIEQDLLALETDGGSDKELVNRIFRAVHTIKGNGSYLKLSNLVGVSHRAETLLDRVRSGERVANSQVTDSILGAVDSLTKMLSEEDLGAGFDCTSVLDVLDNALRQGSDTKKSSIALDTASVEREVFEIQALWDGTSNVFRLTVELAHLHEAIDTKEGLSAGLKSVGKILKSSMSLEEMDKCLTGPCTIYYQTILQSDLLSEHFEIPLNCITAIPLTRKKKTAGLGEQVSGSGALPGQHTPAVALSVVAPVVLDSKSTTLTGSSVPAKSETKVADDTAKKETSKSDAHSSANKLATEQTMRVPVHILQKLLDWTGTMVMARNQLMNEYQFGTSTAFRTLSQAISGVHETVIETRMQTTGSLFERYRRVVRDLSRQLGKEVAFHIEGGDLELDRTILESFADPLTHLIRNCIDHALETPAEREVAGKNRQGNVFLRSYVQSGEIILEVEDDGRGISAEKVCEKAVAKGVISKETASNLTESEKIMLIFKPGFSTKDQATDVSGRGVGMDVVRNNIESVGGSIDVQTRLGQGSTFAAILPLAKALVSSSLTKALIVDLQGERFAIAETAVSEIIRIDDKAKLAVTKVDGRDVYQLRDRLIALVDLAKALEMSDEPTSTTKDTCLVVLQYRKHLFGVVVDNVVGIQEIIVRSTPKILQNCSVYSGHTVLGSGIVALILDINGLVNKLELRFIEQTAAEAARKAKNSGLKELKKSSKNDVRQRMLVFSYAYDEYFAIPLELVAIIKRISPKQFRTIGTREFYQEKSETISVVRLDDFLPIRKFPSDRDDCCLIRPTAVSYPIGILTGPDVSVIEVEDSFETRTDSEKGIVGTFMHRDRLVMLLDLFSVFEQHSPDKVKVEDLKTSAAKILIAEDSLFFRKLITQYIRRPEWEVEICQDGLEAYERLRSEPNRFDLVISDINMPRMDGFELAIKLREDRRFDSMPLVALTTLSDDHFREKGLSLGFDRYVVKIDKHQVCATVAECLQIKRKSTRT